MEQSGLKTMGKPKRCERAQRVFISRVAKRDITLEDG